MRSGAVTPRSPAERYPGRVYPNTPKGFAEYPARVYSIPGSVFYRLISPGKRGPEGKSGDEREPRYRLLRGAGPGRGPDATVGWAAQAAAGPGRQLAARRHPAVPAVHVHQGVPPDARGHVGREPGLRGQPRQLVGR